MTSRVRRFAVGVAAAGALCAADAAAGAAVRAPSCLGVAVEDSAGDQGARFQGVTVFPTGPNTDVVSGFFTVEDGKAFAHIVLADLSLEMPDNADVLIWMMRWKSGEADNWVAADLFKDGTLFFSYGHYEGTTLVEDGRMEGEFGGGPRGVIRMPIPASHGGTPGSTLTDPWVRVYGIFGHVGPPVNTYGLFLTIDRGPDEGFGRTTKLNECRPPALPQQAAPPESPGRPVGHPPADPHGTRAEGARSTLAVRVIGPRRPRAVGRGGRLALRLRADAPVRGLRIRLQRRGSTYASLRVRRLRSVQNVHLRARRAIRPGSYRLAFDGTDAGGRRKTRVMSIRVWHRPHR